MFSKTLIIQAMRLLSLLKKQGRMMATAESCTGGLIAALLTEILGSSSVFERGFVTYSNEAKIQLLGVPAAKIARYGAVSGQVAIAMAEGALKRSRAQMSVSVTGIAGPSGGSKEKPVGLVYVAVAVLGKKAVVEKCLFKGDRARIRESAVKKALAMLTAHSTHTS